LYYILPLLGRALSQTPDQEAYCRSACRRWRLSSRLAINVA
jgi:hypothetical protein